MGKKNLKYISKRQFFISIQKRNWKNLIDSALVAGFDINTKRVYGDTVLSLAAEYGDERVVEYLVEKGADGNTKNADGTKPLHIAVKHNHKNVAEFFVSLGVCVNSRDNDNRTPLHYAVEKFDSQEPRAPNGLLGKSFDHSDSNALHTELVHFLLVNGADFDACDRKGDVPLLLAAKHLYIDVVKTLVIRGAKLDFFDNNKWTVLHYASSHGWVDVVQSLVQRGSDINAMTLNGDTSLLLATIKSHKEVVELLIKSGANVRCCDDTKMTVLHHVSRKGWRNVVQSLVDRGADVNAKTLSSATPLIFAIKYSRRTIFDLLVKSGADLECCDGKMTMLHHACRKGWLDVVQSLVERGSDIDARTCEEYTPLLLAARHTRREIFDTLFKAGAQLHFCELKTWTLLHYACRNGWLDIVQSLVEVGLDINARTQNGETPLFVAAEYSHIDIFDCLLEAGADVNIKIPFEPHGRVCVGYDSDLEYKGGGWTVLHHASYKEWIDVVQSIVERGLDINVQTCGGDTPLFLAAKHARLEIFAMLFKSGDPFYFCKLKMWTLLHYACRNGWLDIVHSLVDVGLGINAKTLDGETPLFLAAKFSHIDIFDFLLDAGADVNVKIPLYSYYRVCECSGSDLDSSEDVEEWSLLHHASHKGWLEVVRSLIKKGIDVNENNFEGDTPLHLALRENNLDITKHLLKAGADCNVRNDHDNGTAFECFVQNHSPNVEDIALFLENGAYIQAYYYDVLSKHAFFKEGVLQDAKLCTQAILNDFNNLDLYEVYLVPIAVEYLPPMEKMKIASNRNAAHCIEQSVRHEIETNGYCNIVEVRPLVLSLMAAKSFINHYI